MDKNKLALFALQAALLVVLFMVYSTWGFEAALIGVGALLVVTVILKSRQ